MAVSYIPLHQYSAYSLAEGAIPVKDLIKRCKEYKIPAAAVTDRNNMFGAMEFCMEAADYGLQPIVGCTVTLQEYDASLVLLAQTDAGYRNLCAMLTDGYMDPQSEKRFAVSLPELAAHSDGLFCLTGGPEGPIDRMLDIGQKEQAEQLLTDLASIFAGHLGIEIVRYNGASRYEASLIELADDLNLPLVATNPAYFLDPQQHEAHDALLCIAQGRYISEQDRRRVSGQAWLKNQADMQSLFADLPEALENTVRIAKSCHFMLRVSKPIFPAFPTQGGRSEEDELRALAREGLEARMARTKFEHQPYWERLEFELETIIKMGFPGYFLIVSDFIRWAKRNHIPVGPGRGSGAGSVVAWALEITDLDPLEFDLLFERFLNPERVSLPDFDIDFCQERRDEVIAYVQQRYGRDRVAQIITFGKLQARAVLRDVGRVLQMSYGQVDRISKMIPNNPANPVTLQQALDADPALQQIRQSEEAVDRLITIALQLEGLYRHASTHAAGVVIGPQPLQEILPLYRDPKSDMPVTQFNMKVIEQAGLIKFDFLGLKTMTVVQRTLDLLDNGLTTLDIPLDDPKTFEMLAKGETTGVFQLESAGMRDLGKQMKLNNFEQISALVALFRPGPMENIPKYLACLNGTEEQDFMHEKLKPVTENTYGVMIYQEQVMQAAQVLAGYSLGQADLLRRAMGKKKPEEMAIERSKFVKGAGVFSDVPEKRANEIFDQIDKFAGYGFNKAHSACYALIAYWTAYLKANHPVHFLCASMILDQGNTDKLHIFRTEAERMGIDVLLPDVNHSMVDFSIEGNAIRYGLSALKGAGAGAMGELVRVRDEGGKFADLNDFLERLPPKAINKKQLESLIAAGALDGLYSDRAQLFEGVEALLSHAAMAAEAAETGQGDLFGGADTPLKQDVRKHLPKAEWDHLEKLQHEFAAVGFYLSAHPLDKQTDTLERIGTLTYQEVLDCMENLSGAQIFTMAGVVMRKSEKVSQKTGNKFAFLNLSDTSGMFECMIFSDLLASSRHLLEPGALVIMTIEVDKKDDQIRLAGRTVRTLEEAERQDVREYVLTLQPFVQKPDLTALANIINNGGQTGTGEILIHVNAGEHKAVIRLAKRWWLPPTTLRALQKNTCISSVKTV